MCDGRKIRGQEGGRDVFSSTWWGKTGKSFLYLFMDEGIVCHVKDVVHVTGPRREELNQVDDGDERICARSMLTIVTTDQNTLL